MKKLGILLALIFLFTQNAYCVNFGMYKPKSEYGLIDGFKFNFFNREEGQKLIELRSETKEEQERLKRESQKPKEEIDENEQFRFMRDGIVPF